MARFTTLGTVAFIFLLIGGINWLLVGLFNFNLVYLFFGFVPIIERGIYIVVGLSALYLIYEAFFRKSTAA